MSTTWRYIAAALLLWFTHAGVADTDIMGRVVGITDGDTLKILTPEKKLIRVRLEEIDAPEKGQPWGRKAKQALADLIAGEQVIVKWNGQKSYQRIVGTVYRKRDRANINAEMLRSGNAWLWPKYARTASYWDLQLQAQRERRGLWALPDPERTPPWIWRHP